jgi:cardiolipin synthase
MGYFRQALGTLSARRLAQLLRLGSRGGDTVVHEQVFTWANLITVARLLVVPWAVWLIVVHQNWPVVLTLLWAAAFMDGLDGYIARRFNQVTRIGGFLDPVIDRVAMIAIALSLAIAGLVPAWLVATVLIRDSCVAVVAIFTWRRAIPTSVTSSGKLGTIFLFFGLPGFAVSQSAASAYSAIHSTCLALVTVGIALYYWSLFQYMSAAISAVMLTRRSRPGGSG